MPSPHVEFAEAQKAYGKKDFIRASAILRRILKGAPSFFQAAHLLAIIELERKNLKIAQKTFLSAIESARRNKAPAETVLTLLTDYTYILSASGDYRASNEAADLGLKLDPNSGQLLFFKCYNLRRLGILDEAAVIADRLLELNVNNPDALCERGQIFIGLDRDEEAFESFKRATEIAPKFSYTPLAATAIETSPELLAEKNRLLFVNKSLWEIEDRIRAKEAERSFDVEFIELARSVYKTNDERAMIKRRINELLGSELIEEKRYTVYPR